ncbi:X2-like carbohydrate binding domain-containing protein [Paenibacillus tengchongensis]|uniref:X2-like carbohydrate binding domain-containing protein n=1 Tax=Paenibacillus tengchongensis TaxID=2608684 RepID=UPI00124DDE9E|nr:X2-like carbohydrate binding domain-containing protein [Paenibacillus tengchongensis]
MNNWFKRASMMMLALTLLLGFVTVPAHADDAPLFTIEGENAQLTSELQVATQIYGQPKPGYSGSGFVWMQNGGTITFNVTVPETGMYAISTRYMQELSPDGRMQYLTVNGVTKGSYMLPYTTAWSDFDFGFHKLKQGSNTIQLKAGWGFAYFDKFTVDFADLDPLNVQPVLTDPAATPETQVLMNYLTQVYGNHIISGQQEIYGGGNDGNSELEFDWIYNLTGKYPAIRGFDLMNYNPLYGWEDGTTARMIDWVNNRGGIATNSWHITVPRNFTAYQLGDFVDWKEATYKPTETNFNTANAVVPGTKEYQYVRMAVQDLAEQLQILQDNNVPVIFRPFHEAEGNGGLNGEGAWFWWASAGAGVYKQLWDQLYTELTETYGLHNLIWTYNSYTYSTSPAWYPGDDQVDIVGYDKYNTVYNRYDGLSGVPNEDAITSIFYQLVDLTDGKKMVAMTENDTVPSVQNLTEEKAGWLFFCPWYGEHLMSTAFNYPATLTTLYQSDYVITLDELPDLSVNNPVPSASITPSSIEFDKYAPNQSDKAITVNANGNTLTAVRSGSSTLAAGTDYTLSGSSLLLKKAFMAQLPAGEHSLVLDFNKGQDPVLKVKITDSTPSPNAVIAPVTAAFDKAVNLQQDVSVALTLNGHQLTSITNGSYTLKSGQDYTASSTAVVLSKAYLSTLPVSQQALTFHFSGGNNAVLTVNVADSTVPAPAGALTIQAFNGNTGASTNGISPKFKIVNNGNSAVQLSNVKLRYYYTVDGDKAQSLWVDWASIGSANVTGNFVKLASPVAGADYALEISFTAAAGSLNPGQSAEIQTRFSKSDWSNYNQANDYSFKASLSQFANNEQVTGYVNGQLVWGIEP